MKLLQYFYYFCRSVFFRGPIKTVRMIYYEHTFDKRLGIRTSGIENPDHLEKDHHHYQGASYLVLFEVLGLVPDALKNKPFIDYGCGKGRALFVAEQCGFSQLTGIDIAGDLLDKATQNLATYYKKNPNSHFELVLSDATTYAIPPNAAVFYFFNPFGESIMQKVADNILDSVRQYPRTIYVIYINPQHQAVFSKAFATAATIGNTAYTEAIIYTIQHT